MDPNFQLVEYFMSEFYANKNSELSHIVSPTFVFNINNGEPMDFAEYSNSMRFMYGAATVQFGKLEATGTGIFVVEWVLSLKTDRAEIENGLGHTEFTVEDGLLEKVGVYFDIYEYVFQYYGRLRLI